MGFLNTSIFMKELDPFDLPGSSLNGLGHGADMHSWIGMVSPAKAGGHGEREKIMDVLLVDDSKTMRLLVQRALRQAGYRNLAVGEAENGVDALAKLSGAKPKLILSDWNMPEMSGIDFLKSVRAAKNMTPFGFITSEASAEIKSLAISSGANFLITKPFNTDDVQAALDPILGGR